MSGDYREPYYDTDGMAIYHGDCIDVMAGMDAAGVDAIVTDPPYGLGFMGKAWDTKSAREFEAWCEAWGREALRVAKPGAHLLAFGAPRTSHRLVVGLEDAGWEIRDTVAWMFGSGFPKSLNLGDGRGTALKPAYEPVVLARKPLAGTVAATVAEHGTGALNIDACRTEGPAAEYDKSPHALGRWPANVVMDEAAAAMLDQSTGGEPSRYFFISRSEGDTMDAWKSSDASDAEPSLSQSNGPGDSAQRPVPTGAGHTGAVTPSRFMPETQSPSGRPNESAMPAIPNIGARSSLESPPPKPSPTSNLANDAETRAPIDTTTTMASPSSSDGYVDPVTFSTMLPSQEAGARDLPFRAFYTAKASRSEREAGLARLEPVRRTDGRESDIENPRLRTSERRNHHPTVKPVSLMRWLVRLVTPPGGVVLDPFMGSGSTRIAAQAEGARFIGIEREEEYLQIAVSRLAQLGMALTTEGDEA